MTKTTIFKTILLIFLFTVLKAVSLENAVLAITIDRHLLPEKETIEMKNVIPKDEYVRLFPNDGNCVYPGKGLLRKWPEVGPHELWRLKIGEGKAAIIESGGKAFTGYQADGKQWAVCLDPATGNVIWKKMLIPVENHHVVNGTVSTPIVDGDRVYFFPYDSDKGDYWYPQCPIFCLQVSDGATIWEEHEQFNATEGGLPLILGNVLYIGSSGKEKVLEAVDKLSGKMLWKIGDDTGENYCFQTGSSLSYAEFCGVPQIICSIYKNDYIGVNATTGEILWHWSFPTGPASGPVPTPVVLGNRMFVSTFQGSASWGALLEFSMKNEKFSADTVYISDRLMCNGFHTPSVTEGAIYGFGRGNSDDALQCLDLLSGKLLWQQENQDWSRNGNMIVADGLIFALTKHDELVLAEASKDGYKELGRVNPGIRLGIQQQPTIFNGRLYLKGNDTIVCYQVE
ncbi:MAG TPA: PQQ-binding-like beta-propeller repeat protein [Prolixibacteraceae bacterium]|nr:PQQ-binding-like beta-propeller repeat protein [Prolixibacteraceae bacterium]